MAAEPYAHITDPLERLITKALDDVGGWSGNAPAVAAAVRQYVDDAIEGAERREDAITKDHDRLVRKLQRAKAANGALRNRLNVWKIGSTPVVITNVETLPEVTPVSGCCVTMRGSVHHLHTFAYEYDEEIRDLVALRQYRLDPKPWKEA